MREALSNYLSALDTFYLTQHLHLKGRSTDDQLDRAFEVLNQARLNMFMTCINGGYNVGNIR